MTESTTGYFSDIRRARPSYSCESCRARRVKCDQVHPKCTKCTRNHIDCIYPSGPSKRKREDPGKGSSKGKIPSTSQVSDAEQDSVKQGYLVLQSGGRSRYTESTFWACVDAKGLELDSLLPNLSLFPLEDVSHSAGEPTGTSNGHSASSNGHDERTTENNLSFWGSSRPTAYTSKVAMLASILSKLPSQETCDSFFEAFIENVHPLIPLVHMPTLKSLYMQFGDWRNNWVVGNLPHGILSENPSFLPLLIAVTFSGSISLMPPGSWEHTDVQRRLRGLMASALTMVGFPHNPSMYSLMAFILFNSMMIREEEALSSCSFVAVAFRIAQAMGLHRDGTDFALDPVSVEERRRVWWYLMHLDAMTSIVSGLPLIASNMLSNTHMIGELRDEYIGRVHVTENMVAGAIVDANYIVTAGRYDASACIRRILLKQGSPGRTSLASIEAIEKEIAQLRERTDERIRRLGLHTPHAQSSSSCSSKSTNGQLGASPDSPLSTIKDHPHGVAETSNCTIKHWGRDLLRLTVEKAHCLLYQPTMQDQELWPELRTRAIPRFQHFLSIFLDMCTNKSYHVYHWLYPGAYQPLQPVAVLLVDLSDHPTSREAAESRALIDRTFSLLGPNGRITNRSGVEEAAWQTCQMPSSTGARQVWVVLEKLRSKVWQELGIDPSFLWNRAIDPAANQSDKMSTIAAWPSVGGDSSTQYSVSPWQQTQQQQEGVGTVCALPPNVQPENFLPSLSYEDIAFPRQPLTSPRPFTVGDSSAIVENQPMDNLMSVLGYQGSTDDAFSQTLDMSYYDWPPDM